VTEAFRVFTEGCGAFKSCEHNWFQAAIAEIVFEPRVGGNIYDRAVDGSECRWARILAFDPPNRVVFSWDISPRCQLETNPDLARSRCGSSQRHPSARVWSLSTPNSIPTAVSWESVRDGVDSEAGWPLYLQRYVALFERTFSAGDRPSRSSIAAALYLFCT